MLRIRGRLAVALLTVSMTATLVAVGANGAGTALAATSCPAATTADSFAPGTIWPIATETLSGGGTGYFFCTNGSVSEVLRPPADFDPLTASADQLQEYGFPPRPKDSDSLSEWTQDMAAWEPQSGTPSLTVSDEQAVQLANWSGYVAHPVNAFVSVQGNFTQPSFHSSSCSSNRLVSWVGIGGYLGSSSLIQAGTEIKANGPTYRAWYEYLGPNNTGISITYLNDVDVTPSDPIHMFVSYETANNIANFYVEDQTTHTSESIVISLSGSFYDGSTAEWIDERPRVNGTFTDLTKYGQNDWYSAKAQKSNGDWIALRDTSSQTKATMVENGTTLSAPGSLTSSTTFTDDWKACQG